jgi:PhzF family phenazine biosynthesis protein
MSNNFFIVDAFAEKPFTGNPAGVVISKHKLGDMLMQKIASEINLSETAFIYPLERNAYEIRWFTPTKEAALCGHATLAAAEILWQENFVDSDEAIHFQSQSGTLVTKKKFDRIEMDFPTESSQPLGTIPPMITELFGMDVNYFGQNRIDYVIEVSSAESVLNYIPDFQKLAQLGRGVILTAKSYDTDIDFVSRVFAPSEGIPEDPVTGSAHCALAPYWSNKLGKTKLTGRQLSARGGIVNMDYNGDRTLLSGKAITIVSGYFVLS